jgi:catechol 2,3-dioxygenase-like lactoylglutathione lyase family enzyme
MITRLGAVPIFISDCERALAFWRDGMGFEVVTDMTFAPGARWLTVARSKGETELILYHPTPAFAGEQREELEGRIGTWTGIVLLTDDVERTHQELASRGVPFVAAPARQAWGGVEAVFLDPDGNQFHLVQRPDFMEAPGAAGGSAR